MTKEKDAPEEGQDHALIAGYLDVKLPSRTRRRRFAGPWKSWRRHWVQARIMPVAGDDAPTEAVELVLSPSRLSPETGVIRVPAGPGSRASVCRTASRSRGHAFVIAAQPTATALGLSQGLAGLGQAGPEHGEVFLAARCDADTERWMAVLRAAIAGREPTLMMSPRSAASAALLRGRRLSRSEGDLLAAPLGSLAMLPASPEDALDSPSLCAGLRVPSPSELRARPGAEASDTAKTSTLPRPRPGAAALQTRQPFRLLYGRRRAETLNAQTCPDKDKLSTSPSRSPSGSHSGSALSLFGGKIASGLLSAGLGLILSTPGGSEAEDNDADNDVDNDADDDVDDDADVLSDTAAPPCVAELRAALDRRRESSVSVASGIYEEISDCGSALAAEAVYENAAAALGRRASNGHENHYEDPALLLAAAAERLPNGGLDGLVAPPPLPPRQNLTPISELLTRARAPDAGLDADGYVQMGLVRSMVKSAAKANPQFEFIRAAKCAATGAANNDPEPTYLPMSPIRPPSFEKHRSD